MSVRLETEWHLHGLRCLRLENRHMAVDVLPERGGNIYRFVDKAADRDVLWKNPRVGPHVAPFGSDFDDHWAGGWDEAFPGGAPSPNRYGETLPYMGEVWSSPATWRVLEDGPDACTLELSVLTPITPARFTRRLTLRADEPVLHVDYRIEHLGTRPFDYAWGVHPALAITRHHRFDVPAAHGVADDRDVTGALLGAPGEAYAWPTLNGEDLRVAREPDLGAAGLHYLHGLSDGWVAATDTAARRGFGLVFDHARFPAVWLVLGYGGFRGFHQALLEPWTAYPTRLADAVAAGRASVLEPGEAVETSVAAVLYDGVSSVGALGADGSVTASP